MQRRRRRYMLMLAPAVVAGGVSAAGVQNFYQIYFEPFVPAGYAVVAIDYQGMGAPGPYSYLVSEVEGRNVLDIARAARQVDGVPISARVAIVGHSLGGHGGLFARQIAADYAPDLTITGSAFAAPPPISARFWTRC